LNGPQGGEADAQRAEGSRRPTDAQRAEGARSQAERDARRLRIRARRDVSTALTGAYRSAWRGHGLTFEELRDYEPGEDASRIEWNATARLGYPVAVQMREERDLLLALLVDVSASLDFGHDGLTRLAAARRAAAALAVAGVRANDRVALVTFASDVVETLRPATGAAQLERVFRALESGPLPGPTDATPALAWAADALPRHSVVVLISDLLFPDPGAALAACARKHDLAVLRVSDPADELPTRIAPVRVRSAEAGARGLWRRRGRRRPAPLDPALLRRRGADCGVLRSGEALIPTLHEFLERRVGSRT
jgi:uncharacterized protein (DUF58 family)